MLLLRRNLRAFFWRLVKELRPGLPYLTPLDLKGALVLVVTKTHQHELFHFHSDVLRYLFGGRFDPLLEEALAVAWSRLQITNKWTRRYAIDEMNRVFCDHLLPLAFDYRSPGYRDWHLYADQARFQAALLDYLAPPKCAWQPVGCGERSEPHRYQGIGARLMRFVPHRFRRVRSRTIA